MPRSRSRSPRRRRSRSRSKSRERIRDNRRRRDREDSRERRREKERRDRSRSRDNNRDNRDRGSSSKGKSKNNSAPPSATPILTEKDFEGKSNEEIEMMKIMGFAGFNTSKNKKVDGNDHGEIHVTVKRRYRQYMNRKGGFNRPLDATI